MENTVSYVVMGFGLFMLAIGLYHLARKSTPNIASMRADTERGCLFVGIGSAVFIIGFIISLL